jgi:hypothetical protein
MDLTRMSLDSETLVFSYLTNTDTGTYACALSVERNLTFIDFFTVAVVPDIPHYKVDVGTKLIILCKEESIKKLIKSNRTKITWY